MPRARIQQVCRTIGVMATLALAGVAIADEPARSGAVQEASPEPLAGPKVETKPQAKSLVRRDAAERLIAPEVNPAQAALELLDLNEAEKKATHAVIVARSGAFDAFFQAHTGEIVNIFNDLQSGRKREAVAASLRLMKLTEGVKELGPLTDQLAAILPPEKARLLHTLIEQYAGAAMAQEREEAASSGEPNGDAAIAMRVSLKTFGLELKSAYERTLVQGAADFDKLIRDLELTAEQEGRLRTLVQDALTRGEPGVSRRERTAIFMELWRDLSADQRKKAAAVLRERNGR